ncbi:MAG: signal peptidase I [Gammaproteobacteria bacterium]
MNVDFAAVMVLLVAASGAISLFDRLVLSPRRKAVLAGAPETELAQPPVLVEYARSFFPIFLIVLLLRSFLVEPFRIPSGSMMPTLLIGDFILVNKYTYGIRLPVLNVKVVDIGAPQRGDIVVFRYPRDPSTPFIKRVVGLPGDRVTYTAKSLRINDKPIAQRPVGLYEGNGSGKSMNGATLLDERLESVRHAILIDPDLPSLEVRQFEVPPGHYFVMGDNRDNSKDSRYWGTVPDDHLIGKAFLIWMNWDSENHWYIDWSRLGDTIR